MFEEKTLEIFEKYDFLEITKYSDQYCIARRRFELEDELDNFVVVEDSNIIGFITYLINENICEIDRISIDEFSKRKSGLMIKFEIEKKIYSRNRA